MEAVEPCLRLDIGIIALTRCIAIGHITGWRRKVQEKVGKKGECLNLRMAGGSRTTRGGPIIKHVVVERGTQAGRGPSSGTRRRRRRIACAVRFARAC
jgi:hypothetical protein